MEFTALSLEIERNAGSAYVTWFSIPVGCESNGALELMTWLDGENEVSLCNPLFDPEGASLFRRVASGLTAMDGGHGWQGDWRSLTDAEFAELVE